jgi:O-antigen ligase
MLAALKHIIRVVMVPVLYVAGFGTILITIFKDCRWGFFLLVSLLPQPNVWYKFHDLPLGKDYMDLLFVGVVIGAMVQGKWPKGGGNRALIYLAIVVSYLSLWNSSMRFSLPLPITLDNYLLFDWKNYAEMLLLYFLAMSVAQEEKDVKTVMIIICLVVFFIALRDYRNFSPGATFRWDKRAAGPFWIVGLGANHMGAFFAHFGALLLGMLLVKQDIKLRALLLAAVGFSLHPLFFAYSRGAYVGALMAVGFYGVFKKRILLVIALGVIVFWRVVLPPSVIDRIDMTVTEEGEIEQSAGGRPELWLVAVEMFQENPVFGVGYNGYAMSVGGKTMESGGVLREGQDVHSIYMRILCEQGVVGFGLFLLIMIRSFWSGMKLYRNGGSGFMQGLGLGFMGCVLAVAVTNLFGDRWSYFVLGGYFWVIWGLVDRCLVLLEAPEGASGEEATELVQ